ncbi:2-hydroxyacyl-CoA dehydratase family protein [Oceanicola sp. 502str15]|uniref:2-hydroxyacyl-CoA dehydratase family protein n=1 Tax=Oceanicola sp. 502str15 TaxID=2696061 RepID=UPI00209618B1|nr:2-hydroxyacyl-CoA dehydratase family protein [Oceanicola sp. 502str15]MCO6383440.1 2-hydroxyacyl-CoA dehydratase [Oceanicola sp. 502str15]
MPTDMQTRPRPEKQLATTAEARAFSKQWFGEIRERVIERGEPYVLASAETPHEIFDVLGLPVVTTEWWGGVLSSRRVAGDYLDLLAQEGFHEGLGVYNSLGAASLLVDHPEPPWGGLPRPAMMVAPHREQGNNRAYELVAERLGVPYFCVEVPSSTRFSPCWFRDGATRWEEVYETHRINLMTRQYREMIALAEEVSGRRFSEAALRDLLERVNDQEACFAEVREMVAEAPRLPVRLSEQMSNTMTAQWHRGSDWAVAHARAFRDEVAGRVARGDCATADERRRLMWVGVGLWQNTDFYAAFEQSHGAVFVWSMYMAIAADGYIRRGLQDPVRAIASRYLNIGEQMHVAPWAGEWVVQEARRHRVDGAVMLVSSNQRHQVAGNEYQKLSLEAAGIPVCELRVDPSDNRAWDDVAMQRTVAEFIENRLGG